jgi:hypothetical protein
LISTMRCFGLREHEGMRRMQPAAAAAAAAAAFTFTMREGTVSC